MNNSPIVGGKSGAFDDFRPADHFRAYHSTLPRRNVLGRSAASTSHKDWKVKADMPRGLVTALGCCLGGPPSLFASIVGHVCFHGQDRPRITPATVASFGGGLAGVCRVARAVRRR